MVFEKFTVYFRFGKGERSLIFREKIIHIAFRDNIWIGDPLIGKIFADDFKGFGVIMKNGNLFLLCGGEEFGGFRIHPVGRTDDEQEIGFLAAILTEHPVRCALGRGNMVVAGTSAVDVVHPFDVGGIRAEIMGIDGSETDNRHIFDVPVPLHP